MKLDLFPSSYKFDLKYDFEIKFSKTEHAYQINGIFAPGVTTVLDMLPKKALVPWAAKMTSESIAAALCPGTPYSKSQIEDICKAGKSAWRKKVEKSADIGSQAHGIIEEYIKTGVRRSSPVKEVQSSVDAFFEWEGQHSVEWRASEVVVGSKYHMFCGTLDAFAVIDGEPALIDFKTSNAIYESHYIQTAAYKICLHEGDIENFEKRWILRFPKDGSGFEAREVPTSYMQDKNTFLAALDLWKNLRQYEEYKK